MRKKEAAEEEEEEEYEEREGDGEEEGCLVDIANVYLIQRIEMIGRIGGSRKTASHH